MLESIAIAFLVLWLVGIVTSFTFGGLIHVLLGVALAFLVTRALRDNESPN